MLAQHLQAMPQCCPRFGAEGFHFVPQTWVLPGDFQRFWADVRQSFGISQDSDVRGRAQSPGKKRAWSRGTSTDATSTDDSDDEEETLTFIAKPRSGARGVGIFLFQVRAADVRGGAASDALRRVMEPRSKFVVQKFLSRPMLIDGYKWDMRVYVLVTSVHPLTVYLYTDGLARFCTDPYEPPASDNLSDREMHLTNFSINYESDAFEDTEDGATGSKRSLRTVLDSCVADGQAVWTEIATCIRKTLFSIGPKMQENYHSYFGRTRPCFEQGSGCRSACFEILGFDFILDEDERLYLLEVNSAPSLSTPTALDEEIKSSMLGEAFRLLRMDGSAKVRHREIAQQRLADRQQEHVARREELARLREERLKCSVGFLSSLGQRKLPPIATSRHEPGEASTEMQMPKTGGDKIVEGDTAEDSESSSDDSSSVEESDWEECDDEFCFLGTPVSRSYVQILPSADMETDEWKEIQAGAAKLAQGWNINARRPQSQPASEAQEASMGWFDVPTALRSRSKPAKEREGRPVSRAKTQLLMPKPSAPKPREAREVLRLKTVQIGL
ncbi:Ttll6 [Symbiodinium sp. CCMP2456]|nr:Ttll6 [Symbiodinium sp. CCMP2456]